MAKLKLGAITDDKSVKLTVELSAAIGGPSLSGSEPQSKTLVDAAVILIRQSSDAMASSTIHRRTLARFYEPA
jgi:hypothetical protein